jgi:hypothetical protein
MIYADEIADRLEGVQAVEENPAIPLPPQPASAVDLGSRMAAAMRIRYGRHKGAVAVI